MSLGLVGVASHVETGPITLPADSQPGDLVVVVGWDTTANSSGAFSPYRIGPGSYQYRGRAAYDPVGHNLLPSFWTRRLTSDDFTAGVPDTVYATSGMGVTALVYRGQAGQPLDVDIVTTAATTAPFTPNGPTTITDNCHVIVAAMIRDDTAGLQLSSPEGFTVRDTGLLESTARYSWLLADIEAGPAGAVTMPEIDEINLSGTQCVAAAIAIRPGVVGEPVTPFDDAHFIWRATDQGNAERRLSFAVTRSTVAADAGANGTLTAVGGVPVVDFDGATTYKQFNSTEVGPQAGNAWPSTMLIAGAGVDAGEGAGTIFLGMNDSDQYRYLSARSDISEVGIERRHNGSSALNWTRAVAAYAPTGSVETFVGTLIEEDGVIMEARLWRGTTLETLDTDLAPATPSPQTLRIGISRFVDSTPSAMPSKMATAALWAWALTPNEVAVIQEFYENDATAAELIAAYPDDNFVVTSFESSSFPTPSRVLSVRGGARGHRARMRPGRR